MGYHSNHNHIKKWTIGLLVTILCLAQNTYAQRLPTGNRSSNPPTTSRDTTFSGAQGDANNTIDTFGVFYIHSGYPAFAKSYQDTALNKYTHQYDLTRQRAIDLMNLGNFGSATHSLLSIPDRHRGFYVGLDAFNPYMKWGDELPFYIVKKAFSELGAFIGSEQADEAYYAKFGQNYANGFALSVDYRRISQLGRLSQYSRQNTRNTALATGVRYQGAAGRYEGFFTFAANTIEQEDNGGVYQEPDTINLGDNPSFSLSSGAILLSAAKTRHQYRRWGYTHYYRLRKTRQDSNRVDRKRVYKIAHDFFYSRDRYKFSAALEPTDTLFGKWFPGLAVDERGLRVFMKDFSVSNQFRIITHAAQKAGKDGRPTPFRGDYLSVGIVHHRHQLYMEPSDTVINNLFLTGEWVLPLKDRLKLKAKAHLGLWDNAGDYLLSGSLKINLKKAGILTANLTSQLNSPSWIQSQFRVSQKRLWQNDFNKTLSNQLEGSYELAQFHFKAMGIYRLVHNHIYFDTLGFPRQNESPISVLSLVVTKDFRLGKFHLDNTIVWQVSSSELIPVPQWFGKHSLYFRSRFRKMLFQVGADVRYVDKFQSYYYNPVTGNFQLQSRQVLHFYPNLDLWFSFKVKTFRFFAKYENMTRLLGRKSFFYTTAFYPYPNEGLRLGVWWRFVN